MIGVQTQRRHPHGNLALLGLDQKRQIQAVRQVGPVQSVARFGFRGLRRRKFSGRRVLRREQRGLSGRQSQRQQQDAPVFPHGSPIRRNAGGAQALSDPTAEQTYVVRLP